MSGGVDHDRISNVRKLIDEVDGFYAWSRNVEDDRVRAGRGVCFVDRVAQRSLAVVVGICDDEALARCVEIRCLRCAQVFESLIDWTKCESEQRRRQRVIAAGRELERIISVGVSRSQGRLRAAERDRDTGQGRAVLGDLTANRVERSIGRCGREIQRLIATQIVETLTERRHREVRLRSTHVVRSTCGQMRELVRAIGFRKDLRERRAIVQNNRNATHRRIAAVKHLAADAVRDRQLRNERIELSAMQRLE